ncbi:hypothetical protein CBG25_13565 [Arsenophonus sp. ENCA]|nr:hypothetical protein CBG25_13565 [Arsenophonus sp. ENCA]
MRLANFSFSDFKKEKANFKSWLIMLMEIFLFLIYQKSTHGNSIINFQQRFSTPYFTIKPIQIVIFCQLTLEAMRFGKCRRFIYKTIYWILW